MPEQKYPEPTVGALIFNAEDKLFLMKSHKWHDKYVMPGGHIELGETAEEALKREVKEETGLDIHSLEFICHQEFVFGEGFWKKRHFIFLDYACRTNSTDVTLNSEGQEYVWASMEDLERLDIEPYTMNTINELKEKILKQ